MNLISQLTQQEFYRQKETLNLIASENYPSPTVLQLLGSVWSNKYAEGYPGKRYYAGNVYTDELESYVQKLALEVFDKTGEYGVNVQVLSGTPANAMVFLSVLEYGDTVLSLNIDNGGHISHMHKTSRWLKFFKLENYDVKEVQPGTFEIDLEDFRHKLEQTKPKLIIIGASSYSRRYEFGRMCELAHDCGSLVLADIAHINGLVATDLHDTPFKKGKTGADFISMTTHKTFRGPRAAMVFAKNYLPDYIQLSESSLSVGSKKREADSLQEILDRTIFPGNSGGPHLNKIAAIGQACLEILGQEYYPDQKTFKEYSQAVLDNCKTLETTLNKNGLEIISPTQNHLCMIRFPSTIDSLQVQTDLEKIGIITNRNVVPFDPKSPWRPSGMRLGTAALTSRGLTEEMSKKLGEIITDKVFSRSSIENLNARVKEISNSLNWWYSV